MLAERFHRLCDQLVGGPVFHIQDVRADLGQQRLALGGLLGDEPLGVVAVGRPVLVGGVEPAGEERWRLSQIARRLAGEGRQVAGWSMTLAARL
jgi:hypothetical protein